MLANFRDLLCESTLDLEHLMPVSVFTILWKLFCPKCLATHGMHYNLGKLRLVDKLTTQDAYLGKGGSARREGSLCATIENINSVPTPWCKLCAGKQKYCTAILCDSRARLRCTFAAEMTLVTTCTYWRGIDIYLHQRLRLQNWGIGRLSRYTSKYL